MHIAFAVESIEEARTLLEKKRVKYWEYGGLVGQASVQIFFEDPCGNMIELQED
jgi:catechol-2,3-dioxygenase